MYHLLEDRNFARRFVFDSQARILITSFVEEAYSDNTIRDKVKDILAADSAILAVWTAPYNFPMHISMDLAGAAIAKSDTYVDPPDPVCNKPLLNETREPVANDLFFFSGDLQKHG
jgi:hypothetical protein